MYYDVFPKPCWPQTLVRNIVLQISVWEAAHITTLLPYLKPVMAGYHLPDKAEICNLDLGGNLDTVIPVYVPSIVPCHFPTSNLAHAYRPSCISSGFFNFACISFFFETHSDISSMISFCSPRQLCSLSFLYSQRTLCPKVLYHITW